MKHLSIYIVFLFLLPWMFWEASCEGTKPTECKADSLTEVLNLHISEDIIAMNEDIKLMRMATDSLKAWKNVVAINHISIDRLNNSLQDLTYELEEREERIAKFKNRLDSAIVIIKRQNEQLKRCMIDGRASKEKTGGPQPVKFVTRYGTTFTTVGSKEATYEEVPNNMQYIGAPPIQNGLPPLILMNGIRYRKIK